MLILHEVTTARHCPTDFFNLFSRYILTFSDSSFAQWQTTLVVGCLAVSAVFYAATSYAQQLPTATAVPKTASAASSTMPTQTATSTVAWNRLTPLQQQALKPLAASWHSISEPQRLKWLAISKNYPSLPPAEQVTMHGRMNEWVALSPVQRAEARLNFAKTKELSAQLTPEEKLSKWQAYQALSPAEKESLASKAGPKPIGAAVAVRPVPPQKLVGVAPHSQNASAPVKPLAPATAATVATKPANATSDAAPNR